MVGEVVSSIDVLRQGNFRTQYSPFHSASERRHQYFSVRLIWVLRIIEDFLKRVFFNDLCMKGRNVSSTLLVGKIL